MTRVLLEAITMKRQSKSYIDSLHAILSAARLFEGPKYRLAGLTGMAFKFTVHERLLPLSVSAYGQWGDEHSPAIRNLGLYTVWDAGRTRHPTFAYYQQDAVNWIKQSLDVGIGVIYWIPEFGVICGYDDEDAVFYIQDGHSSDYTIVLYDNLGLNFTGFWYCQIFGERMEPSLADMVLESLRLAIHDWDTPYKTLPNTDIASGKLAYTFLRNGLQSGDYDEGGAVYIMDNYMYTREEIASYLRDVSGEFSGLEEASAAYEALLLLVPGMKSCIVENGIKGRHIDPLSRDLLCALLREAEELEERAVTIFRAISERYPDLSRSTIRRWGVATPR
ncbi:hypothetical protein [Paenibacillus sp. CF384]|uniref:hypothetical protein n=1 Tax=Paenibacillus sp. CF384 TaxID=1884382 RepID=UPI000899F247|nr:hypothetical protein [Paenibacillus sp. CF384]SDW65129.1 hypothetical protein SAMN05518855_10044 [Paenibacillus sp. CF384]